MKKLLAVSLFLVGCGQQKPQQDPRNIHGIDPVFQSYVAQFEAYLGHSIGDIPIQFVPQSGLTVGICIVWDSQWKEIEIDPDYWNATPQEEGPADYDERLSLIVHELGHCSLGRGHLDTYQDINGYEVFNSFMNYAVFFSSQYPQTLGFYMNEMFHPAPGYPLLGQSVGGPEERDSDDFIHLTTGASHGD